MMAVIKQTINIDTSNLDITKNKLEQIIMLTKEVKSLIHDLTSKDVEISLKIEM